MRVWVTLAGVIAVFGLLVSSCGSDDGLSREEVDRAIAEAIAGLPEVEAGVSAADMEAAIRAGLEGLDPAPSEVTMAEVQEAISDAMAGPEVGGPGDDGMDDMDEAPSKSDPAAYTQFVVDQAITLYEQDGIDVLLNYVNDPENVDGEWYVFVVDGDDFVIGHYEPDRLGLDLKGWVGTDINGYVFGLAMLEATEEGRWVPYVYRNPAIGRIGEDSTREFELKNAWVVRHDGLLFGSGWYINSDQLTIDLSNEVMDRLRATSREETIAYFSDPNHLSAGLLETVEYYNSADAAEGTWVGFYAELDGTIVFHSDSSKIGANIVDDLGPAVIDAPFQPAWITQDDNPAGAGPASMRIYGFRQGDTIFGAGSYRP